MKRYEVVREIFYTCSKQFILDRTFIDEIETDDIKTTLEGILCRGELTFEVETKDDGTIVYLLNNEVPERYSFSEF